MTVVDRFKKAWNVFSNKDSDLPYRGASYGYDPGTRRVYSGSEGSIIASIYNRIAIDVAAVKMKHVRVDENGRFSDNIDSYLNRCLTIAANVDQTGTSFMQDVVLSLFDYGCIAITPVDITQDPYKTNSYDIQSLRVAQVVQWYPRDVQIRVYNDRTGLREDLIVPKSMVAIVQNPFYAVMNEPNSTLRRLTRKLALLDAIDEQSSSGKLDLIIQLPYVVKNDVKQKEAETRRQQIADQLSGSKYGIAYTDGTEKITQLNRPVENNLLAQITYLQTMLYGQLGITEDVFNGTADEKTMLNYYSRTVDPILAAIAESMKRTFLTQTAITQGQSIEYYRDIFKTVSTANLAEMGDKFTRNAIFSSNDMRSIMGVEPSKQPIASQLANKNLNGTVDEASTQAVNPDTPEIGS